MARSSKKTERLDYNKYNILCNEYNENAMIALMQSEDNMGVLIKQMRRKYAEDILASVGPFTLDDGEVSVEVTPVKYGYNSRLHAAVYKLNIDATKGKGGVITSKYGSEWSSKEPETVYEAADALCDKVTETAWDWYNRFIEK